MSIAAYRSTLRRTEAPRDLERRILVDAAARLEAHAAAHAADASRGARLALLSGGLHDALVANQACWRALRQDVSEGGNGLPPDLRAALVSLAIWVDRQTGDLLGGGGSIAPLVDLNRTVAAGLARTAVTGSPEEAAPCPSS